MTASRLTLPHGDPLAIELMSTIQRGDLLGLRGLLRTRPELSRVRMIGRKGGWRTPLHAAADWPGYFPAAPAAVALLLEAAADPNDDTGGAGTSGSHGTTTGGAHRRGRRGVTGLLTACAGGQRRAAQYLLDHGADINWRPDYAEGTPLDVAQLVGTRRENVIKWLRKRGAASAE